MSGDTSIRLGSLLPSWPDLCQEFTTGDIEIEVFYNEDFTVITLLHAFIPYGCATVFPHNFPCLLSPVFVDGRYL